MVSSGRTCPSENFPRSLTDPLFFPVNTLSSGSDFLFSRGDRSAWWTRFPTRSVSSDGSRPSPTPREPASAKKHSQSFPDPFLLPDNILFRDRGFLFFSGRSVDVDDPFQDENGKYCRPPYAGWFQPRQAAGAAVRGY